MLAPLLGADLEHAAGFFHGLRQNLAFVDRQRQRLFAVDVFAGPQGVEGDLHVPVVGRADGDDLHILAIEQFAIVAE